MATYRIRGKAHVRATVKEVAALDSRGLPFTILQQGESIRLQVGTLVDDVTPEELAAFPDRFELLPEELVQHLRPSHHAAVAEETKAADTPAAEAKEDDKTPAHAGARRH